MYHVVASRTFQKQYKNLQKDIQQRIKTNLMELAVNPYQPRSKVDIKQIAGTSPPKHRLRVGDYRIVYYIDDNIVKIIEAFRRGRGYRK